MNAQRINSLLNTLQLRRKFAIEEAERKGLQLSLGQELLTFDSLVRQAQRNKTSEAVNAALKYERFLFSLLDGSRRYRVAEFPAPAPAPWWARIIRLFRKVQ